jgi:hypothetical protein
MNNGGDTGTPLPILIIGMILTAIALKIRTKR